MNTNGLGEYTGMYHLVVLPDPIRPVAQTSVTFGGHCDDYYVTDSTLHYITHNECSTKLHVSVVHMSFRLGTVYP